MERIIRIQGKEQVTLHKGANLTSEWNRIKKRAGNYRILSNLPRMVSVQKSSGPMIFQLIAKN